MAWKQQDEEDVIDLTLGESDDALSEPPKPQTRSRTRAVKRKAPERELELEFKEEARRPVQEEGKERRQSRAAAAEEDNPEQKEESNSSNQDQANQRGKNTATESQDKVQEPPTKRQRITPANRTQTRLQKEFDRALGCQEANNFKIELVDDDLHQWKVTLFFDPKTTKFGKDLQRYAKQTLAEPALVLSFTFAQDHPFNPPLVRALQPRVKRGTGYVYGEGAICVDLLSPSGWSPANRVETVLEALRSLFLTQAYEARVDFTNLAPYSLKGWKKSYQELLKHHPDWK